MAILIVLALTALIVFGALSVILKRLLYVSAPNEALIFSGRTRTVGAREVGYRVVRGGRALRVPFFELIDSVDLTNIAIDIEVKGAYSKGGIPLNVHGVANIKLPGEEPLLNNAIERFLGRSRQEITGIAKETLEGNLRGVLAQLTPEEVNQDKTRFAQSLLEEAEHDLNRIGLILDTLKIQNITDDVGYLNSIGRIQGAKVRMGAAIAEAKAKADAEVQQATNWCASEIAKVEADLAIAQQETQKRVVDAQTRRAAMIAESEGQVAATVAQVTAEIERQKARALQVKRKLDADVVQVAEASRRAMEEEARGQAAMVIERGKAEAEALRRVFEAFALAGEGARDVLALQQVIPMLTQVSGAGRKLVVQKVSVLPPTPGNGGDFSRAAIAASEQIKAAMGVDLPAIARRLQQAETALPAPSVKARAADGPEKGKGPA
jgi:flotillin